MMEPRIQYAHTADGVSQSNNMAAAGWGKDATDRWRQEAVR